MDKETYEKTSPCHVHVPHHVIKRHTVVIHPSGTIKGVHYQVHTGNGRHPYYVNSAGAGQGSLGLGGITMQTAGIKTETLRWIKHLDIHFLIMF